MNLLSEDIKKIILKQTDQRKAEIYCELNRWEWPKELKKFKPDTYGTRQDDYKHGIVIMEFIQDIVGDKAVSKEWNKNNMTEDEFEKWYRTHFIRE